MDPRFQTLAAQYEALANEALSNPAKMQGNIEKMKAINTQMAAILDSTIHEMTASGPSSDLTRQRDELIEKLVRIQRDYNGLLTNTDKLETLRRIRGFQETDWKSKLRIYIIALAVLAVVLALFVLFRRQKTLSTAMAPMSATSTPAFT
jgi:hypothetical protein